MPVRDLAIWSRSIPGIAACSVVIGRGHSEHVAVWSEPIAWPEGRAACGVVENQTSLIDVGELMKSQVSMSSINACLASSAEPWRPALAEQNSVHFLFKVCQVWSGSNDWFSRYAKDTRTDRGSLLYSSMLTSKLLSMLVSVVFRDSTVSSA